MNDNRNMLLAIVLSAIVLIGWSLLSERYFPTAADETVTVQDGEVVDVPGPSDVGIEAGPDTREQMREMVEVLGDTDRVAVRTPSLTGSINLAGARFDDLTMTRHHVALDGIDDVRLLSPAGAAGAYFAQYGWSGEGVEVPGPTTRWQADRDTLTPEQPVTLRWDNGSGQTFLLEIAVDDDYLFTIAQRVENRSANAVAIRPYALASRAEASTDESFWTVHVGPMGVFDDAANYDIGYDDLEDAGVNGERFTSTGGWLGFTDKYWLTALVPDQREVVTATMRQTPSGAFQTDYLANPVLLQPGQASTFTARLVAGAKEKGVLDAYEDAGIPKLSKAIDWGWFEWFMRPIFDLLRFFFQLTGNFGVAIIIMTVLVRFALYPLANKQFRSMAGMRRIQPKMKALQERYKDDKPRFQQEMLKLYQEEKLNPAAGCLPIFLQIPIFYALYKVLLVSVEMRHQPFALWLQDLSAPDPLTPVNLFGLLPFDPPGFLAIGILPILLGVTMWLQFRLNPAPMDDIQKQVFGIMPWILMFIMAPFAAGLQLYWVVSNILTIAQQKWLYHKYDLEKDGMKAGAHPKGT
ncbi:membrane protein insertase YidC [Sphingomicrobium astaxanthinifaciens]|uniref:membrane protein insertase YidC n=1 Tax=Sphingomicrobium astaxanthinifaciens TaxID=1227949 RepID=UPI001FCBA0E4|nr:membrane protein insertase YidC [Sphingomicrobium astaxanthinifaciens]MCJ7422124.1 membrane protein insertase YidC [Sphingomicrobium astaxanthinifaciens]